MNDALLPFKRYFQFSGRSRQREYWLFVLLVIIVFIVAITLDNLLGLGGTHQTTTMNTPEQIGMNITAEGGIISAIWIVAVLIPGFAVAIRRLHDIDRTGWWLLIALLPLIGMIVLLVFFCTPGTRGPNRFGADPAMGDAAAG